LAEVARATVPDRDKQKFLRYVDASPPRAGSRRANSVLPDYTAVDRAHSSFTRKIGGSIRSDHRRIACASTSAKRRIGASVAERAIGTIDPASITHLILTSCTGFFAPGPDVYLLGQLRLRADVERTMSASWAAMRISPRSSRGPHRAGKGRGRADGRDRAVLASLQKTPTIETPRRNSLFAMAPPPPSLQRKAASRTAARKSRRSVLCPEDSRDQ